MADITVTPCSASGSTVTVTTGATQQSLNAAVSEAQGYRDETNVNAASTAADAVTTNANAATSTTNATEAQLDAWIAEAQRMTADSYATEAEDVFVKTYTSDGDGTFTASTTTEYSALHWAAKASTVDFDDVVLPTTSKIGDPTHMDTLAEVYNHVYSAGVVDGGVLTDNLDGSIDLASSTAVLRATGSDNHSTLYSVIVPASLGIVLTDQATNYVYADYNSGTPIIAVVTSPDSIDMLSKVPLYVIVREGTILSYVDVREQNVDHIGKNQIREFYTAKITRGSGGIVSDAGTLHLACTAGVFFFQLNQHASPALDTTGVDTFEYYSHVAGAWVENDASVIDNLNYDDGTNLVALGNSKYGVHWVYIIGGQVPHYAVLYGDQGYTTVAQAENATVPTNLPASVEGLGILIGQIVVQKSDTELTSVSSAFTTSFDSTLATDHNNLAGLQGGIAAEYFHLTSAQHALYNLKADTSSATGVLYLPDGTTAERPTLGATDMGIRYNTDLSTFEGWDGTTWTGVGGGATGGGSDKVFVLNEQTVTTDYTIPTGQNAHSAGTILIDTGITVVISTGSEWVIS